MGETTKPPLIEAEHIFKEFRLYHHRHATLKEAAVNRLRGRAGRYAPFWALRDVSLSVADGEVLGVIGPNGAGKSTLLGIIAGIVQPTSGRVTLRGTSAALMGLGVGLDMRLTGRENAYLYGSVLGVARKEMARRMDEILDFAELGEFADSPMRTYSSGMTARLAFSVAISVTPEILLLDEVLAVGDLAFRERCLERMMSLRERIRSIVIIAHQMNTIQEWCDRVLWLQHGAVAAYGPTEEVTEAYEAATRAAGAPARRAQQGGVFRDVPYWEQARTYVEAAYRRGVMEERSYDAEAGVRLFAPGEAIRRRDAARYLCKATGKEPLESATPRFADVPATDPDYGWIERLADGASWRDEANPAVTAPAQMRGEFAPDAQVTRGEIAAYVCRALGKASLDRPTPTFADVPATHAQFGFVERLTDPESWHEPPVLGAVGERRMYHPADSVTRIQAAVILTRAWNLLPQAEEEAPDTKGRDDG